MLDAYIIDEINKRNNQISERPRIQLPIPDPIKKDMPEHHESDGNVDYIVPDNTVPEISIQIKPANYIS
jgi:hypothetical protein